MKIAIIGSRNVYISNLGEYLNENDEIVTGGANGVDSCAIDLITSVFPLEKNLLS